MQITEVDVDVGVDADAGVLSHLLALIPGQRAAQFIGQGFDHFDHFGGHNVGGDTDMPRSAWGSCGKPFEGMEVRIVDPDSGLPVPAGTVGMIQIRGPHTLRGVCRRSREDLFTADGFYPTGDVGHLDDGFMFYHGRSDDMFKVSGATVYPSEVEQALRTLDGVDNAFVTNSRHSRRPGSRGGGVRHRHHDTRAAARPQPKTAELLQGSDGVAVGGLR